MEFINKAISLMERMNNIDKYGYSSLLTEISIQDKYQIEKQNGKTKLQFDLFQQLCQLDPTTTPNKVGKYSNWVLAKYNPNADLNALRIALEWYADGIKNNITKQLGISTDINTFKSYDELITTINGIRHSDDAQLSNSEHNNRQKLEGQFEILGSTSNFDIITCHTWEAERYFGSGTKWCTVANEEYFNRYTDKGVLFILYPKNGDKKMKMQFHFESKSFANYEDRVYRTPVECIEVVITNENECYELLQLCKQIWNEYYELFIPFQEKLMDIQQRLSNGENPMTLFDSIDKQDMRYNGLYRVELMKKFNFLRPDNTLVWEDEKWFDEADYFVNGFARVCINGKGCNFLRPDGTFVRKPEQEWFDGASKFKNGFAIVKIKGKGWNFLRLDGTEVWKDEKWFDDADYFVHGFAHVYIKDKGWNFLRPDGTLVWKDKEKWFDDVFYFDNGLAEVSLDGEDFKLDEDGNLHDI